MGSFLFLQIQGTDGSFEQTNQFLAGFLSGYSYNDIALRMPTIKVLR